MRSHSPADWQSFFVAIVGAAAALTGLLFVAVSINLENIIKDGSMLPTRAAETLASLLFVMVAAALTLVPQNIRLIGLEILIVPP
jgi:modulator of FtsH protease